VGSVEGLLAEDAARIFMEHCRKNVAQQPLWQALDFSRNQDVNEAVRELVERRHATGMCVKHLSDDVAHSTMALIATYCHARMPRIWRLSVDYYWRSPVFDIVQRMNARNVKLFDGESGGQTGIDAKTASDS